MKTASVVLGASRGLLNVVSEEIRGGTLLRTLQQTRAKGQLDFAGDISHAELLARKAFKNGPRPLLEFQGESRTYAQMNAAANRAAAFLASLGAAPGDGVAVMMKNSVRWLDAFFGGQRLGMYAVPVNVALRGKQLAHVLGHSEARYVCVDHDLAPFVRKIRKDLERPPRLIVSTRGVKPGARPRKGEVDLEEAFGPGSSATPPVAGPRAGDPCLIMYTSGTTGLPKGVVLRYGRTGLKKMALLTPALLRAEDVYYTCLPLFHANALFLTLTNAMHADARVALFERFSASRFWDQVRESRATVFNALGAMIPILMKQPPRRDDREHRVRYVLSAACPADMWEPFERRFGVRIVEGYGAVDGGGHVIINFGQAPVGSMGKPLGVRYRLVDEAMHDVPVGQPGELIFQVGKGRDRAVEYYRDEQATSGKVRNGWLHTGDLVYADAKGYLYFKGRKTESLRRRGENISAYEVEQAVLQHPDVLECAVYAVPSELGEDDVMAAVVCLEGRTVRAEDLAAFLSDHLARFAIPRYYRFLDELPKTETQRVIKGVLAEQGVTGDTVDLEPGGRRPGGAPAAP